MSFATAFQLHRVAPYHKTTAATIRTAIATTNYARATILFSKLNNENDSSSMIDSKDEDDGNLEDSKNNNYKIGYDGDDDLDGDIPAATSSSSSILQRFLNPRIDDPGLLLSDALLAQIVAPTLQIYWLLLANAPSPSWLHTISRGGGGGELTGSNNLFSSFSSRGSLLAPTLVHGAGLAICWLAGALAAKMFEKEAFTLQSTTKEEKGNDAKKKKKSSDELLVLPTEEDEDLFSSLSSIAAPAVNIIRPYQSILTRLVQAGAFSSGLLMFATQLDLLLEYRGNIVTVGMSDEIDFRLLLATVEVINDIVWEAVVITTWRLWHANFMSNEENRRKRF